MTKKVSVMPPRKNGRSVTDEKLKARLDEQHEKKLEVIRQFRAEHEKNMAIEKNLENMALLSFEPVDYSYLLEAEPWVPQPLTSYEYLKTEAVQLVEDLYKNRLTLYAASFGATFLLYIIFPLPVAFTLFVAVGLFLVYQTSQTLKQKQHDLIRGLEQAQEEISRRQEEERQIQEEARKQHEFSQQLRQDEHRAIMEGKPETIGQLIKESLEEFAVPVSLMVAAEINGPLVSASVVLPQLSAIPQKRTQLLSTGYIEYEDKPEHEIYKQYMDLVTALLLQVSVRIFEIAPTVCCVYMRGINETGSLLLYMKLTRELMGKAGTKLIIAQLLKDIEIMYATDINLKLLPVDDPGQPAEWDSDQSTYKITAKVLKHG